MVWRKYEFFNEMSKYYYSSSFCNLSFSWLVCTNMDRSSFCVACRMSTNWIDSLHEASKHGHTHTTQGASQRRQRNSSCNVTTPRTAQKDGEVHHMLLFHTQNFDEFHARLYNQLPLLVGQPVSDCCSLPWPSRKSGNSQLEQLKKLLRRRRRAR